MQNVAISRCYLQYAENIIKKKYISFAFDKTPRISISCKQISVQNMEYQYDLL